MKTLLRSLMLMLLVGSLFSCTSSEQDTRADGKADFDLHCSGCHPNGGNVTNPGKTLMKMSREANGVKSVEDIVSRMRKPGPGMKQYDKKDLSDARARAIAEYILKTFK